jgi:ubiquinol oxidase
MVQPGVDAVFESPPKLSHDELVAAQQEILAVPRRRYGLAARLLFRGLDLVYGEERTLSKFKVLELTARVPYQAWEQVAYVAMTHVHEHVDFARRIYDRVAESRAQQDNEQWHLLIINELLAREGVPEGRFKFYWLPQALAFLYYQWSWLLFVIRPTSSYKLNADFEDHAEHEYMSLVAEHPDWENTPFESKFAADYGQFDSLADLFRQIGHDEHVHKLESLHKIDEARFRFEAPPGTMSQKEWRSQQ